MVLQRSAFSLYHADSRVDPDDYGHRRGCSRGASHDDYRRPLCEYEAHAQRSDSRQETGRNRDGGVDVLALKEILGHEQLNTTQIYTHVSNKALEEAVSANPLAKVKKEKK